MKSLARVLLAVFVGAALLVGPLARTAAAESRNRALERVLGKGMYSADEGRGIQRSFAVALEAGVEERDALSLVEDGIEGEFEAAQLQRVLSLLAQLVLEGLPVEAYVDKIEEGVSKKVPADRVVRAAERRALALNKAKLIMNSLVLQGFPADQRNELLSDLAEALEGGRTPEDAGAILKKAFDDGESAGAIRRKLFP